MSHSLPLIPELCNQHLLNSFSLDLQMAKVISMPDGRCLDVGSKWKTANCMKERTFSKLLINAYMLPSDLDGVGLENKIQKDKEGGTYCHHVFSASFFLLVYLPETR